ATSGIMRSTGIQKLVTGYPSHGFVIDRKEARTIFARVEKPEGLYAQLSQALGAQMASATTSTTPQVQLVQIRPENASEAPSTVENGAGSAQTGQPEVAGNGAAADTAAAGPNAAKSKADAILSRVLDSVSGEHVHVER